MSMSRALITLAQDLFDCGAFKDKRRSPGGKGFKLKLHERKPSAPLSPFYLNLRTAENPKAGSCALPPSVVASIGMQLCALVRFVGAHFHYVVGIPYAGEPLAEALVRVWQGLYTDQPRILKLTKEMTWNGDRRIGPLVSSDHRRGSSVGLVDDLVTGAESKIEAIDRLKEAKLKVESILVVVDREQGGAEALARLGYRVHALFKISDLLRLYFDSGNLDRRMYEECVRYVRASRVS